MRRILVLATLALMPVAAGQAPVAVLEASGLQGQGNATALLDLAFLAYRDYDDPVLELEGRVDVVRVEVDHFAGGASIPMVADVGTQYDTTTTAYTNATIHLVAVYPGVSLEALCLAKCTANSAGRTMDLEASAEDIHALTLHRPYQRQAPATQPTPRLHITTEGTLQVVGDLIVSLWEADFEIHGAEASQMYRTGDLASRGESTDPEHVVRDGASHADQAFLFIEGGRLNVTIQGAAAVHGERASLDVSGSMAVAGAWGSLQTPDGALELSGQDLRLTGHAIGNVIRGEGSQLRSAFQATEDLRLEDGTAIQHPGIESHSNWAAWLAAAATLLVGLLVTWRVARRRARTGVAMMLLRHRRFLLAGAWSRTCLALGSRNPLHYAVLAKAAWERDRHARAARWGARAYRATRDSGVAADMALLTAAAHAHLRDDDRAGYWASRAVRLRPEFKGLLGEDEALARSLREVACQRWLAVLGVRPKVSIQSW